MKLLIGWSVLAPFWMACAAVSQAKDIVQTATEAGQFMTLLQAAQRAGLDKALRTPGPFTIFAPTDAAFQALPTGMADELMKPENKSMLAMLLSYHVLAGRLLSTDVEGKNADVKSLAGQSLIIHGEKGVVMVNDAKVIQADVEADNGVIQVIDKVLIPPMPLQPKM